jgi:hypothetical protein
MHNMLPPKTIVINHEESELEAEIDVKARRAPKQKLRRNAQSNITKQQQQKSKNGAQRSKKKEQKAKIKSPN